MKKRNKKAITVDRRSTGHEYLALFAGIAVTAAVYLPSLGNKLVADSWVFMVPRSFFSTFGYFFRTMLPPEHNAFWLRPIPMFTYWLDTVLWPGTAWGPHLQNVLFHLINIWLVWLIVRYICRGHGESRNSGGASLALFAACIVYGLHPLTVGSVAWVAARFDVMSVTFGLAGLYLWFRWSDGRYGNRYVAWCLLLLLLSLFSKEQGIVFIAVCFLASMMQWAFYPDRRKRAIIGMSALVIAVLVYTVLRVAAFSGLGGYMEARHGLSVKPPVFYLVALLYPYMNVIKNPSITVTFVLAACLLVICGIYELKHAATASGGVRRLFIVCAAVLCLFGLATNAPNPGMTFERIMGHAESRFALNAIAGMALLVGALARVASGSKPGHVLAVVCITVWGVTAAWRTDVQIQSWANAGMIADAIIEDTIRQAPDPPPNSRLLFFDIPRSNEQWAYIYGIGLKEALQLKYGRTDIDIVRFPTKIDQRNFVPDRDYAFRYDRTTGGLERLFKQSKPTAP